MKLLDKIIPRLERRTLERAATLLNRDDVYDEYFFAQCRLSAMQHSEYIIKLGANYALVKTHANACNRVVDVTETKPYGEV